MRHLRATTIAVEKQSVLHILSVFVEQFIQHAKRMSRIILSPVACPTVPRYLINGKIVGNKLLDMKCAFEFLYNFRLKRFSC